MTGIDVARAGLTVARAAITAPKLCDQHATGADVRRLLADDHVHAALVVDHAGVLLAVVERDDLAGAPDTAMAAALGRCAGRTVAPDADLRETAEAMLARRRRRLAVVDEGGRLVGLLCMKHGFDGFCSDSDVRAREAARHPV